MWIDIIRRLDIDELKIVVEQENTFKHVLERFNIIPTRSKVIYDALRTVFDENDIDYSHFGYRKLKNLSEQLIKNSTYNVQTLKKRLIKENLIINECSICGNKSIWNDKPLVLQLHHKNGDSKDNRLENLELLCPNCHSQTNTFSGKNIKNMKD